METQMEGKRFKKGGDELGGDTEGRRQKYADKESHNSRHPGAEQLVRGGEQRGRERYFQSPNTIVKRVDPDNPHMANFQQNMVIDFSEQQAEVPSQFASARNHSKLTTINKDGKAAICLPNAVIGAGEDDKGNF